MKQETLEEAAENEASTFYEKATIEWNKYRQVFEEGAKWQQERSYSEEDLRNAYRWGTQINQGTKEHFNEWFEQFKKK